MTDAAHFEARKWAYRQTKEGTVVSFLIHPNDLNSDFAVADLGTRYMVAFAKIGDDEQPVAEKEPKERRRFEDMPLSQQCALRCADPKFQNWLGQSHPTHWIRFSDLMRDSSKEDVAAQVVRQLCGISSRKELNNTTTGATKWRHLDSRFLTETGRMAEQR